MKRLWRWLRAFFGRAVDARRLVEGVPNLSEVGPGLWRSAQPVGPAEWRAVSALGVRRVLKLNYEHEGSDAGAEAVGLEVHELAIEPRGDRDAWDDLLRTFVRPDGASVLATVRMMAEGGGVLVHCTHGEDRTGLVVGFYRVLKDGWTKERAWAEMLDHGFHPELRGLSAAWEHLS